jgi:protein KRI1
MNFVLNKGWIDTSESAIPTYEEIVDDTDEIQENEDFEEKHNFRFEEKYLSCIF